MSAAVQFYYLYSIKLITSIDLAISKNIELVFTDLTSYDI